MSRKEKEKEFFAHHMDKFRKAQIAELAYQTYLSERKQF